MSDDTIKETKQLPYLSFLKSFRFALNKGDSGGSYNTYTRDINLPWDADGFIVRQCIDRSSGIHIIRTNMTGKDIDICAMYGSSTTTNYNATPNTYFSEKVKSGTYKFNVYKTYTTEANRPQSVLNTTSSSYELFVFIEFIRLNTKLAKQLPYKSNIQVINLAANINGVGKDFTRDIVIPWTDGCDAFIIRQLICTYNSTGYDDLLTLMSDITGKMSELGIVCANTASGASCSPSSYFSNKVKSGTYTFSIQTDHAGSNLAYYSAESNNIMLSKTLNFNAGLLITIEFIKY